MEPVVKFSEGSVKGSVKYDVNNEPFYSFTCIPYGQAPLGSDRFRAPKPVQPWEGIKDATKENNFCYQRDDFLGNIFGSEDCLSLHVFTKKLPKTEDNLRPVLVYIHGGGFTMGSHSTQIYGPNLLLTEDIVFVCITYRVGFLGFLTLNDLSLDVPGNAGFKDQVLALKWIRRNIKHFNGDPNNVTVFGASAGAVSVELLMVSPTAKDLFHKAIIQSGSSLNTYARARFQSSDLALFLQKPGLSERELLNLLSEMPMKQLIEIQTKYLQSKNSPGNLGILGPIIEKPNPSAFLTKEPLDLIQSGDYHSVPVITGYNDNEGALYWYYDSINKRLKNCSIPFTLDHALPHETDLNDDEQVRKIKEVLKKYYLNEQNKTNTTLLMGDSYFVPSIIMSAKNQARISKNPVYLFRFALDTSLNRLKRLARLKCRGACHGDELGYFFTTSANNQLSELEKTAQRKLISLWTNFMKYGNPTPKGNDLNIEWKPIQNEKLNFLHIGNEFRMDVDPEADRMKIWDEIYKLNPRTAKY